jgi:hypothetical protein
VSPATARPVGQLAHASGDPSARRVVAARCQGPDRVADRLDRDSDAPLVDAVGPAEAARLIVAGHRGGQAG